LTTGLPDATLPSYFVLVVGTYTSTIYNQLQIALEKWHFLTVTFRVILLCSFS